MNYGMADLDKAELNMSQSTGMLWIQVWQYIEHIRCCCCRYIWLELHLMLNLTEQDKEKQSHLD